MPAWSALDQSSCFLDCSFEIGLAVGHDGHGGRTINDQRHILSGSRGEAGEVEVFLKRDQTDAGQQQDNRDSPDPSLPLLFAVKNHRNTQTDDADQHDGENDDPGNGRARRDERSRQRQCEETDEEASRRHEKRFLELDAAAPNLE